MIYLSVQNACGVFDITSRGVRKVRVIGKVSSRVSYIDCAIGRIGAACRVACVAQRGEVFGTFGAFSTPGCV